MSSPRYDFARFGAEAPRFSPRQSDLLWVVGTIAQRQAPVLKRIYEQMMEPQWVMAFGTCASCGGFYDNYTTVPGIDKIIPCDVYVPGCPPRPEAVFDGLLLIQDKIASGDAQAVDRQAAHGSGDGPREAQHEEKSRRSHEQAGPREAPSKARCEGPRDALELRRRHRGRRAGRVARGDALAPRRSRARLRSLRRPLRGGLSRRGTMAASRSSFTCYSLQRSTTAFA